MPPSRDHPSSFTGAVLCGGASRRMGTDKALLEVDGHAMAARVAAALRTAGADPVVAVGGDAARLEALGLPVVADLEPGGGPLMAIVTALRSAPTEIVLVASCDLVSPDVAALRAVVQALADDPGALAAIPVVDGRRQWVHAAWRRSALAVLEAGYTAGERSVHRAAGPLPLVEVLDLPAAALVDADAPGDLPG